MTIPHRTGFGPEEWFYSVVVVLVGSCPGGELWSWYAMVGLYFFLSGGELSSWEVVLEPYFQCTKRFYDDEFS